MAQAPRAEGLTTVRVGIRFSANFLGAGDLAGFGSRDPSTENVE
jgi:hypothetical protein